MESPSPILEVKGVTKSFGAVDVLQGIDFSVEAGSVTALVGDNGAGKSTLIKGLAGIQPFDSGTIFLTARKSNLAIRVQPRNWALKWCIKTWRSVTI